ncbi:hypothetical protein ACHAXS_013890 [Conticribra weissflogii]
MSQKLCAIGVHGLTPTGQKFAAHHASSKIRVCISDEDPSFPDLVVNEYRNQTELDELDPHDVPMAERASRSMIGANGWQELIQRVEYPRKIFVFGTYGDDEKFREVWDELATLLQRGDMVVRWGAEEGNNEVVYKFYTESIVENLSKEEAKDRAINLFEMIRLERDRVIVEKEDITEAYLIGGPKEAYEKLKPFLKSYAAVGHVGNSAGCAHYASMVQRAIEFGVSQPYAEAAEMLRGVTNFVNQDIGRIMNNWNKGDLLPSYILEISGKIYYKRDDLTPNGHIVNHMVDCVDLKDSDTWAAIEATKLGVPVPTLNAALEARYFSVMKDDRVEASSILKSPTDTPVILKDQATDDLQKAIYCTNITAYAEGISILLAASEVESWDANIAECLRIWNHPGSFLESNMLNKIISVCERENFKHLLIDEEISAKLNELQMSWRRMPALAFCYGIPCPTFCASLTYYDTYRMKLMPISLLRAQRDFFGGHGYERFDRDGYFSCCWTRDHTNQKKKRAAAEALENETAEIEEKRKRREEKALS